jgi:type I pantothenate kinase
MTLRETAFRDPRSFFKKYAELSDKEAIKTAQSIWTRINLRNLHENILPSKPRADLILTKSNQHKIETVALRKL